MIWVTFCVKWVGNYNWVSFLLFFYYLHPDDVYGVISTHVGTYQVVAAIFNVAKTPWQSQS